VVEGEARMRSNLVLDSAQLRQGWVLACQAEPASARLAVEY
jgi:3-ketosteroid 9alpha-monooxygenase subunit B